MVSAAFSTSGGASRESLPPHGPRGRPLGPHALVRRARSLCRRERAFAQGVEATVMVSGGQDSLALLHVIATGALRDDGPSSVRALHVNHHLRGAESDADEALVRDRCAALGVSLEVVHAPIDKGRGNVQAEARAARRAAALDLVGRSSSAVVVLGHTLDDQVETMLYRLGRYGGLQSLVGMLPVDPPWIRPLLTARRAETGDYCDAHGLVYAVDRGNEHPGYARTGLRGSVVPAWEAALPGAVESAGRAAEVAAEAAEIVRAAVRAARDAVGATSVGDAGETFRALSVARMLGLPRPLRRAVIRSLLEECVGQEVSRGAVLEVETLLSGGGSAERPLGRGWVARREYGSLTVRLDPAPRWLRRSDRRVGGPGEAAGETAGEAPGEAAGEAAKMTCPGEVGFGDLVVQAQPVRHFRAHDPHSEAYLDAAVVTGPLWVRAPRPGDRMRPLGSPGRRLIQDILVDLKVPRAARGRVPVIGCGKCILWLGGCAVAEEGRISSSTRRMINLRLTHATAGSANNQDRSQGPGYGVDGT